MKVANSNVNQAGGMTVTVFARSIDGTFYGGTMYQHDVGHPFCWRDSVEEIQSFIDPTESQLSSIVEALDAGTISLYSLRKIGGSYGGYSEIDI